MRMGKAIGGREVCGRKPTIVLAAVVVALICLVSIEVLLHLYFRVTNGAWVYATQKNFRVPYVQAVSDRRQYALKSGYRDLKVTINAAGFRGALPHDGDNRPLICFMGDSVPYGAGVSDAETIAVHLENVLERLGQSARVLNGGVPSYNLRQSIDRWRLDVAPRWRCDMIIINAANDVSLYDYYKEHWTLDLTWATARFGISVPPWSATGYFLRLALNRGAARSEFPLYEFAEMLKADLLAQLEGPKATGVPIVLATVTPCYYRANPGGAESQVACAGYKTYRDLVAKWQPVIDVVNDILKAAADKKQVFYMDWAEVLDGIGRQDKFVDFIHFSDSGAKEIAGALAKFIVDNNLLSK